MKLIDKLTDYLISRRLKKQKIYVSNFESNQKQAAFRRVLNTLRENNIMVVTKEDGIYVRMAGNESDSEAFTLEWGKIYSFDKKNRDKITYYSKSEN